MSSRDVGPMDADIRAFVDADREHVDPVPDEARARILLGIQARLAGPGGGGGDGGGSGSPSGGGVRGLVRAHPLASVALALVAGGASVGALRFVLPEREHIVVVERFAPAAPVAPLVTSGSPGVPEASGAVPAPPPIASPTSRPTVDEPADTSSAERQVLDTARQALSRGDAQAAWAAVGEHERQFPRGRLTEEREALAVRALVALGQGGAARRRAALLRARFPRSIFLPAVDSALGTLGDAGRAD